jgi:non-specific serine/threonine protein kinase
MDVEVDNLRAALHWADRQRTSAVSAPTEEDHLTQVNGSLGLRLATALWPYWWTRGHLSEGRAWLERFLVDDRLTVGLPVDSAARREASSDLRARALAGAGILAAEQTDYATATALLEESMALRRGLGDSREDAQVLNTLGTVARDQGDYERATALFSESLKILQDNGDPRSVGATLTNLGEVARYRGDLDRAQALHDEGLTLFRWLNDQPGIATSLYNHGLIAQDRGERQRALALHQESLTLFHELGDMVGVAWSLEGLATVIGALGQPERAARLFGRAAALREAAGAPLPPAARDGYVRVLEVVRAQVGEAAFDGAWAEGMGLSVDRALDVAFAPA